MRSKFYVARDGASDSVPQLPVAVVCAKSRQEAWDKVEVKAPTMRPACDYNMDIESPLSAAWAMVQVLLFHLGLRGC